MKGELAGVSVLLLEDEPLISLEVQEELEDQGALVHVAYTCKQALKILAEHQVHFAVLDLLVGDEDCTTVAAECRKQGIPFLVASGAHNDRIASLEASAVLSKPYSMRDMVKLITELT